MNRNFVYYNNDVNFGITYDAMIHIILSACVIIVFIVYRNSQIISIFQLVLLLLLFIIIYLWKINDKDKKIDEQNIKRKQWIIQTISELLDHFSLKQRWQYENTLGIIDNNYYLMNEISANIDSSDRIAGCPDIKYAEEELIKSDERASFLIGITIFIPVIFAMAHIFRYVSIFVLILEGQIAIIIAQIVTTNLQGAYIADGWKINYHKLIKEYENIISNGKAVFSKFSNCFYNAYLAELGQKSKIQDNLPSNTLTAILLLTISQLPPNIRGVVLDKYLERLAPLPEKEDLIKVRWEAYRGRLFIITTIGMALMAMMSAISRFDFSNGFIPIETTPFLPIATLIVTLIINSVVTLSWLSHKQLIRWNIIWITIFGIMYYLSLSFFIFS